jgi:sigma-E factor negative regulatory protein RseA
MTHDTLKTREAISALADGQLRGQEFARVVEAVSQDDDARATWHAYHLVGDVLRSGDAAAGHNDLAFVARLQLRLKREELVVRIDGAPDLIAAQAMNMRAEGQFDTLSESANASRFRWKMVAGLASLAAVAAVGWSVTGGLNSDESAKLAAAAVAPVVVQVAEQPQVMIRDPRLDELLAAHKQFGGTSALQMPAGFLRNATFEVPNR